VGADIQPGPDRDRPRRAAWVGRVGRALWDGAAWAGGLSGALLLRYDFHPTGRELLNVLDLVPVVLVGQWVVGYFSGLYRGRWLVGSSDELTALGATIASLTALLTLVDFVAGRPHLMPISAALAAGMLAFAVAGGARLAQRRMTSRRLRWWHAGAPRTIVFGAGDGGQLAVQAMLRDPNGAYLPVALLDDDPDKQGLSVNGVRVVGTRADIMSAAERFGAQRLVVAVPTADSSLIRDLLRRAEEAGLDVRILPPVRELLGGDVRIVDIREPNEIDLLGRQRVETDLAIVGDYLAGRVVVVTGAGGSIGSELCRQISAFEPAALIKVDRDETALHGVEMSLEGRALFESRDLVLLDIRDREPLIRLFMEREPDVVFHAAALKHLSLLEYHPAEAVKTNVWGTHAVLEASALARVERFVGISTDKAANPCSILGYSKRIGEGLTAHFAQVTGNQYLSVRFGNVLHSRGSVLTAFQSQINSGGPITVTHPDVARYFMTVREAVELVLQAGAIGQGGEVLILEMGEQVRILDLAQRLAARSNPPIPIAFTGLRAGEKIREELFSDHETGRPSRHPLIACVTAPPINPLLVADIDLDDTTVGQTLRGLAEQMADRTVDHPASARADGTRTA
jgi:FlaA1/EpsC-like NDP-sugar epimerase